MPQLNTSGEKTITNDSAVVKERLKRLISSGMCTGEDVSNYTEELKKLTWEIIDERAIKHQSEIFKALADPIRLKVLKLLDVRELCVCEIMAAFNLTQPTASHHLNILERAGLIKSRKEGRWVFYKRNSGEVTDLIKTLTDLQ
jgi:ArsR family transcriptional regulator